MELFNGTCLLSRLLTQVSQDSCMRALEDQVRVEFEASLQYILMAAHFDQVRPGLGTGREGAGWRAEGQEKALLWKL